MRPTTVEERAAQRAERLQAAGITPLSMPMMCSYTAEVECPKSGGPMYVGICFECVLFNEGRYLTIVPGEVG